MFRYFSRTQCHVFDLQWFMKNALRKEYPLQEGLRRL